MKVGKIIGFILVLIVLLSSCTTTSTGSSSNRTDYNKLFGNSYRIESFSSKYDKDAVILSSDPVVIFCLMSDFSWQRPFEEKIQECFEKNGIKTIVASDYGNDVSEKLIDQMVKDNIERVLYVSFGNDGNYSTYNYGGGISKMSFDVELHQYTENSDSSTVIKIVVDINGTNNDMEDFSGTKEKIIEYSSKKIVEEYMKYVTYFKMK